MPVFSEIHLKDLEVGHSAIIKYYFALYFSALEVVEQMGH